MATDRHYVAITLPIAPQSDQINASTHDIKLSSLEHEGDITKIESAVIDKRRKPVNVSLRLAIYSGNKDSFVAFITSDKFGNWPPSYWQETYDVIKGR